MNNHNRVYHLLSNFTVSWDIDEILKKFIEDQANPVNERYPYYHPSKKPHWQIFHREIGICFARNFDISFKEECYEVIQKLKVIQKNINNSINSVLIEKFLTEKFVFSNVNLIKVMPNTEVELHNDITRNIALNIGLKNSNTHIGYVGEELDIQKFDQNRASTYTINEGDGYLISVKHPHCLKPVLTTNKIRYVISYTFSN